MASGSGGQARGGKGRAHHRAIGELVIVSHVVHHDWRGRLWAYAPYAREIEIWADLFPRLLIAAPGADGRPADDAAPIDRDNVGLLPQRATGGTTLGAKLRQIALLPLLVRDLSRALRGTSAVHVRCPGNLGLLGILLAPLFSRRLIAKYAGQWGHYPGEAMSFRLQRAMLASPWWRGPVTVYGEWPGQPARVVPFFTSVLSDDQLDLARRAAASPRPEGSPLRVLFVGRLSKAKNVDALIDASARARDRGADLTLTVIGDGPERSALETRARNLGLDVRFTGGIDFEGVLSRYAKHDVSVLVSETEGWPKAITEAMAFGLVAIGSRRGLVPQILDDGRGLVIEPGDVEALSAHLLALANDSDAVAAMGARAAAWGQRYSLGTLRAALGDLMSEAWNVPRDAFLDRRDTAPPSEGATR